MSPGGAGDGPGSSSDAPGRTNPPAIAIRRRVLVSGRVQGVGFRAATHAEASARPGLRGWVRNLPDGRVEAVFQGPEAEVLAAAAWCEHGPAPARVSGLEVIEEELREDLGPAFELRRDG